VLPHQDTANEPSPISSLQTNVIRKTDQQEACEGTNAMIPPRYFVSFSCINILERRTSFHPLCCAARSERSYQLTPMI